MSDREHRFYVASAWVSHCVRMSRVFLWRAAMTHDELQAIKARAEVATPGPWTTGAGKIRDGETRELVIAPNDDVIVAIAYGGFGNPVDRTSQDRKFIAHARTDVPALVAEVERLRGLLNIAENAIDRFMRYDGKLPVLLSRHIEGAHRALGGQLERSVTGGLPGIYTRVLTAEETDADVVVVEPKDDEMK